MSPRTKKTRNRGCKFMGKAFKPNELEVLKLCDADGLKQEEADRFKPAP